MLLFLKNTNLCKRFYAKQKVTKLACSTIIDHLNSRNNHYLHLDQPWTFPIPFVGTAWWQLSSPIDHHFCLIEQQPNAKIDRMRTHTFLVEMLIRKEHYQWYSVTKRTQSPLSKMNSSNVKALISNSFFLKSNLTYRFRFQGDILKCWA